MSLLSWLIHSVGLTEVSLFQDTYVGLAEGPLFQGTHSDACVLYAGITPTVW